METATGIFRNQFGSWRSSPVRWLLDRVSHLARSSDPVQAVSAGQDRWQEMFWTEAGRQTAGRGRGDLFEQAELWTAAPVRTVAPAAPREAAPVRPAATPVSRAQPAPRGVSRRTPASAIYAERGRQVCREDIARYLQVNNAVYGRLVPVADLALPRQSFNAELKLWKGSEIGTPFVTGC